VEAAKPALDPARFDTPVNSGELDVTPPQKPAVDLSALGRSSSREISRFEQAASKQLQDTIADTPAPPPLSSQKLDPKRFDHPINQGPETLTPLAQAVDGALDAAISKKRPSSQIGQTETGMIDSARLKAKVASLKAGLANPPSMLPQSQPTPAAPAAPAEPPKPPEDNMTDAVSRFNRGRTKGA